MAQAGPWLILGTMSGTSLDGVDAALVRCDGDRVLEFGRSAYRPYSPDEQATIRAAFGRWPGERGVARAARVVEAAHAEVMADFPEAQVFAFHGQTLAHDPGGRGTHQCGSGARLAQRLGRPVVWDFRSADVAFGGQGAPLVPFFHHAVARHLGAGAPLAFLNLGGVGNLTWVDPQRADPSHAGACLAFDTGPANAPLNDLMRARRGLGFDDGGALAQAGRVDGAVIARFLEHPFFRRMPPKSLDRNAFDGWLGVGHLSDADAAATLSAAAVAGVAQGAGFFPRPVAEVLVAGGGRHNAAMMAGLRGALGVPVRPVDDLGLDGDMFEAQAFAHLAARVLRGLPTSGPATTGVAAAVGGGQVSRPDA